MPNPEQSNASESQDDRSDQLERPSDAAQEQASAEGDLTASLATVALLPQGAPVFPALSRPVLGAVEPSLKQGFLEPPKEFKASIELLSLNVKARLKPNETGEYDLSDVELNRDFGPVALGVSGLPASGEPVTVSVAAAGAEVELQQAEGGLKLGFKYKIPKLNTELSAGVVEGAKLDKLELKKNSPCQMVGRVSLKFLLILMVVHKFLLV